MVNITLEELNRTTCLEEAIMLLFRKKMEGRMLIPVQEAMKGEVAALYNQLGLKARQSTYDKIALDFRTRTDCYAYHYPTLDVGTLVEVGCGSGLLSLALAEHIRGSIVGIDVSEDMIVLAQQNLALRKRFDEVQFRLGSVYDLAEVTADFGNINYVVCRNSLHRFQDPACALESMYGKLSEGGTLYIRDLRRDADWKTVVERISEERWKHPVLVEDYIGAMAGMLTVSELSCMLDSLRIKEYQITNGEYRNAVRGSVVGLQEYEKEVEFVCVVRK